MDEIDIWRAAEQMRKLHGADAAIQSAMRADKFLDQGDAAAFEAWRKIVAAINELDRMAPCDREARH